MSFQVVNMSLALPEMFMLAMACVILLVTAFAGHRAGSITCWLSKLTFVVMALIIAEHMNDTGITFDDSYIKDGLSDILKLAICIINLVVLFYSATYLKVRGLYRGEYFTLVVFATLGMLIMASAYSFLTLYLGLELLSLCLYAMVAMQRHSKLSTEAAMKYFILGAIASGMLLYGMSLIYGVTGSLSLETIATVIETESPQSTVLSLSLVFIVIGIAFKFGAVPFHMWLPDVYHGAPTAVTLFIATAPKVAAFAMIMRLLDDGLLPLLAQWQSMLILLAIASMVIGNIVAIAQTNLKRMLAYSTISHVGFLLMGVLSGTSEGYSASLFYTLVYSLTTLGGFGMIILMSRQGFEADNIDDYKGLSERSPWFALMMMILMFSMAGIPPMAGFYAKLLVIKAVIDVELLYVAITAVVMSVVGAFYYLRMVKVMYFDKPEQELHLQAPHDLRIILSSNALLILGLGIFPGALIALCNSVFV
jgi:NADH-quinone oxidoreductase subunit N